jgi:hypothetical protein
MLIRIGNFRYYIDRNDYESVDWEIAKNLYPDIDWQDGTVYDDYCSVKVDSYGDIVLLQSHSLIVFKLIKEKDYV